jgi:hypothetical protein
MYAGVCRTALHSQLIPYNSKPLSYVPQSLQSGFFEALLVCQYITMSRAITWLPLRALWQYCVLLTDGSSQGSVPSCKHSVHDKMTPTDISCD